MTSTLDAVRVNQNTWGWSSVAWSIDGQANEGLRSIDFEEKLELRIVPSNFTDQLPLGMSLGRYQIAAFPIRMLRDSALALKRYLQAKAPSVGSGSFGQATFDMGLQLSGLDAPDGQPSSTVFATCRIVSESNVHEHGTGAALTEFRVACLAITQDSLSLFDATSTASAAMPWADTITVAGTTAPGKWTLIRGDKVFGWDIRKGTALVGATVVPTGDELIEPEFLVELWTPTDYAAFGIFETAYLKKQLTTVAGVPLGMAIGIDHPELKRKGCTSVVPKSVGAFVNDGFGVATATVKFLQYRKPFIAMTKPNAAIPDAAAPKPTAQDQIDIEIQAAKKRLQALAGS